MNGEDQFVQGFLFDPTLAGPMAKVTHISSAPVLVAVDNGFFSGARGYCGDAKIWTVPDGCVMFKARLLKELPPGITHARAAIIEHLTDGTAVLGAITLIQGMPEWRMQPIAIIGEDSRS